MSTDEQEPEVSGTIAVAGEPVDDSKRKLEMDVRIGDAGPCKKHIKVSIARAEIERQFDLSLDEFGKDIAVPGFRPGRAPRQLVVKRFRKQVSDQVKSSLLMAALAQIDEDYDLEPIAEPKLDLAAIELPDAGPMAFEFDVEVRPEFELPDYKGLSLKRPVRPITESDIETYLGRYLERYGQVVPKLEGAAAVGDYVVADLEFRKPDGSALNVVKEIEFRLQPELRFRDGSIPKLAEALAGARPGETRRAEANLGTSVGDPALRGATVPVHIHLHDLKQVRLPELNAAFLSSIGFANLAELREAVQESLKRRMQSQQRQALRQQILDQLLARTPFDLPADLVRREEESTIRRLVMQLRQEGFSDSQIRASEAAIRANAHESSLRSLKELILLSKIARTEGIEVEDDDYAAEIEAMAEQTGETPRRVRSRIEKEGVADQLNSQILERKVLDFILKNSTVEDDATAEAGPNAEDTVETLDQAASGLAPTDDEPTAAAADPESGGEGEAASGSVPETTASAES